MFATKRIFLLTESPLTAQVLTRVIGQQLDLDFSGWTRGDLEATDQGALYDGRLQAADLLLFDLASLGTAGCDLIFAFRKKIQGPKYLAIGVSSDGSALLAIEAGVDGLTMTQASLEEVLIAVRGTLKGETPCCPRVMAKVFGRIGSLAREQRQGSEAAQGLSPREQQVLELLAQGLRNKEIAVQLGIAFSTAKNHVQHVMEKLKAGSRCDAIRRACERGLVELDMPWQSA